MLHCGMGSRGISCTNPMGISPVTLWPLTQFWITELAYYQHLIIVWPKFWQRYTETGACLNSPLLTTLYHSPTSTSPPIHYNIEKMLCFARYLISWITRGSQIVPRDKTDNPNTLILKMFLFAKKVFYSTARNSELPTRISWIVIIMYLLRIP